MATPLDTSFITLVTPALVFIFVFAIFYALLIKTKLFGEKLAFNAVIALAASLLFIIVPQARGIVLTATPWMLILVLFVVFIFIFFMALGVKGEDMIKNVAKDPTFITITVIAIIVIFLVALTNSFGPFLVTNQEPGFWNSVKRALFHPRMLGALFILFVASYTVRFIVKNE